MEIKQKSQETIDDYARRFKTIQRKATEGAVIPDRQVTQFFTRGLKRELVKDVTIANPGNLNEAITAAKRTERGIRLQRQDITENIKVEPSSTTQQKTQEPNQEYQDKIDMIVEQMGNLSLNLLQNQQENGQFNGQNNRRNNQNNQSRNGNTICQYCGLPGHHIKQCRQKNVKCYNCGESGHYAPQCKRRVRNIPVNYINNDGYYYDDDYYDNDEWEDQEVYYQDYDLYVKRNRPNYEEGEIRQEMESRKKRNMQPSNIQMIPIERQELPPENMQTNEFTGRKGRKMTEEQKQKMKNNRRIKNKCNNCGRIGHFGNECTEERTEEGQHIALNALRQNVEPYNMLEVLHKIPCGASMAQMYDQSPNQRRIFHQGLRRGFNNN